MRTQSHSIPMSKAKRAELLARTYVLHIVPERAPQVSRTVELLATQTLDELHLCIQREFGLDYAHLYAFYMSGRAWDKKSCYEGPDKNAARVTLQAAGCKPGKEFLYIFDFGDELRHLIRVESQGALEPGVEYPRTLAAIGDAPPQYQQEEEEQEPEVDADLLALADEAAKVCTVMYDDLLSEGSCLHDGHELHSHKDAATLEQHLELERRLREALLPRPNQLAALDAHCEYSLLDWVSELIFDLAGRGQGDEALVLHEVWNKLTGNAAVEPLGSRAKLLLRAGRTEEAKAEADKRLSQAPDDFHALSIAADIYEGLGDLEQAEALCRRYYEVAEDADDWQEELAAGHQLADLLRKRDKNEEAEALEQSLEGVSGWDGDEDLDEPSDEDEDEDDDDDADLFTLEGATAAAPSHRSVGGGAGEPVTAMPKIGRNEPCPCGSGKKYKKCCGA